MALNLRLPDAEAEALRAYADETGQPKHELAVIAVREYLARQRAARAEAIERIIREDAEVLDRLGR